jgi:uncharacterized membrane protein
MLAVIAAGVVLAAVDGLLIEVGVVAGGFVLFAPEYVWYRRQWDRADELRVDERLEWVAYRSEKLTFRVFLALAVVLFIALETGQIPITAEEGFVVLILGMVTARFGLYGWYNEQSV